MMILILDNLRSAHNVGALFRTADGAGVDEIYLVGITPKPAGRDQLYQTVAEKTITKTALGAELAVPFRSVKTLLPLLRKLKQTGCAIVALEEGEGIKTIDYRNWKPKREKGFALVVGNEVDGLSDKVLALSDVIIRLPMKGVKKSLNVSVAGGIALYSLSDTIEKLEMKRKRAKNRL